MHTILLLVLMFVLNMSVFAGDNKIDALANKVNLMNKTVESYQSIRKSMEDNLCKSGRSSGCLRFGLAYYFADGVEQDFDKAFEFFEKACNFGNGRGCAMLGAMYNEGVGIEQNYFESVKYYKKACGLDIGAGCSNLGVAYELGEGVKLHKSKAAKYYGKACDLKEQLGCSNYAILKNSQW